MYIVLLYHFVKKDDIMNIKWPELKDQIMVKNIKQAKTEIIRMARDTMMHIIKTNDKISEKNEKNANHINDYDDIKTKINDCKILSKNFIMKIKENEVSNKTNFYMDNIIKKELLLQKINELNIVNDIISEKNEEQNNMTNSISNNDKEKEKKQENNEDKNKESSGWFPWLFGKNLNNNDNCNDIYYINDFAMVYNDDDEMSLSIISTKLKSISSIWNIIGLENRTIRVPEDVLAMAFIHSIENEKDKHIRNNCISQNIHLNILHSNYGYVSEKLKKKLFERRLALQESFIFND